MKKLNYAIINDIVCRGLSDFMHISNRAFIDWDLIVLATTQIAPCRARPVAFPNLKQWQNYVVDSLKLRFEYRKTCHHMMTHE